MARIVKQTIPAPPDHYDQQYTARVVDALNRYMFQRSQGEIIAARFVATDTPIVGASPNLPDTSTLPTGTIYLSSIVGATANSSTYAQAGATGSLTLTTTAQPVPGCSVTLAQAGVWLVLAVFDFVCANEQNNNLYGAVTGSSRVAVCDTSSQTGEYTIGQNAIITGSVGQVIQMSAYKAGGTGNSSVSTHSSLTALWIPGLPLPGSTGNQFLTVVQESNL